MSKAKGTTLEGVAQMAMSLGQRHLSDYGAVTSRKDFTQRQLMACLILRAYLKTTYRGLLEILATSDALRRALGMDDKLPHYTTLQKFSARSHVLAIVEGMIRTIGRAAARGVKAPQVAVDATGMETTTASAHFNTRRGRSRRKWVKLSLVIFCGSLLPLALHLDWGPSNDKTQAAALLSQALGNAVPSRLYADAGYDAEWIHQLCHEGWGIESVIKPVQHRNDGTLGGHYRSAMTPQHLEKRSYGRRWHIESFISGLKRTTGSALSARSDEALHVEAALRVLAYALRR
jgi:hypothetical protein